MTVAVRGEGALGLLVGGSRVQRDLGERGDRADHRVDVVGVLERVEDVGRRDVAEVDLAGLQRRGDRVVVLVDAVDDLVDGRLGSRPVRVALHADELADLVLRHDERAAADLRDRCCRTSACTGPSRPGSCPARSAPRRAGAGCTCRGTGSHRCRARWARPYRTRSWCRRACARRRRSAPRTTRAGTRGCSCRGSACRRRRPRSRGSPSDQNRSSRIVYVNCVESSLTWTSVTRPELKPSNSGLGFFRPEVRVEVDGQVVARRSRSRTRWPSTRSSG